ncbi:sigma-70 family RNA polymerase sigma factor [Neiella marina]|uniref:Sigma-70 family RNA polymerase sigma factor n=1 Tax=Neiella holothuriorum TaxID=2870530 RepID=A0ABS7EFL3_9GAMM|nr:sigma-70 family RNA polymerase sigma factor [Neiella holothuriorum]MBW8190477.1 sigma-70 family RNA polymerase sigma factor [Neiella holothuriorum]
MSFRNDDQLLDDYGKRGDAAAFDILYQRFRKPLFGFIRQQLPEAATNDVFQDCWTDVIKQAANYMPCGSFRAYLFTIARRKIADYWRAHHKPMNNKLQPIDDVPEQASPQPDPLQIQLDQATNAVILMCVGRLPHAQQQAFMLKQTGLPVDEISLMLGATFETVKSRIRAAYDKLRHCWERNHE